MFNVLKDDDMTGPTMGRVYNPHSASGFMDDYYLP